MRLPFASGPNQTAKETKDDSIGVKYREKKNVATYTSRRDVLRWLIGWLGW